MSLKVSLTYSLNSLIINQKDTIVKFLLDKFAKYIINNSKIFFNNSFKTIFNPEKETKILKYRSLIYLLIQALKAFFLKEALLNIILIKNLSLIFIKMSSNNILIIYTRNYLNQIFLISN